MKIETKYGLKDKLFTLVKGKIIEVEVVKIFATICSNPNGLEIIEVYDVYGNPHASSCNGDTLFTTRQDLINSL